MKQVVATALVLLLTLFLLPLLLPPALPGRRTQCNEFFCRQAFQ